MCGDCLHIVDVPFLFRVIVADLPVVAVAGMIIKGFEQIAAAGQHLTFVFFVIDARQAAGFVQRDGIEAVFQTGFGCR